MRAQTPDPCPGGPCVCASTRNRTDFTAASICTPGPCTCASSTTRAIARLLRGGAGDGGVLVIFAQPSVAAQPREGPLHDPSLRQRDEARLVGGPTDQGYLV